MITPSVSLPNLSLYADSNVQPTVSIESSSDSLTTRSFRLLNDAETQTRKPPLKKLIREKVVQVVKPLISRIKKLGTCLFPYLSGSSRAKPYQQIIAAQQETINELRKTLDTQDKDWSRFIDRELNAGLASMTGTSKPMYLHDTQVQIKLEDDVADQGFAELEEMTLSDSKIHLV